MINREDIDEWLIRSIEDDLTIAEQAELNAFIELHPEFKEDLNAYHKTILTPDTSIIFADKNSLKKSENKVRSIIIFRPLFAISIAASLMLLIAIGWLLRVETQAPALKQVAHTNSSHNINNIQLTPVDSSSKLNSTSQSQQVNTPSIVRASKKRHTISTPSDNNAQNEVTNQKENIASAVTYFTPDTLHYVEADDIMQIVYLTNLNTKISTEEISSVSSNMNRLLENNSNGKGVKAIANMLDRSGNKSLAKAFEKASKLATKRYELSYNSPFISFHKTFNSNQ